MRWSPGKGFTYPVLTPLENTADRDYINQSFQSTSELSINTDEYTVKLDISCHLSEESLLHLIEEGKAKYATEIHCASTFLRHTAMSSEPEYSIEFGKGQLNDKVEVLTCVVCIDDVKSHQSKNLNPDTISEANFEKGYVLAIDHAKEYYIDSKPLKNIGSIFKLIPVDEKDKEGKFSIDFTSKEIQILLYQSDAGVFDHMRKSRKNQPVLLTSVYLMAVTEALREMINNESEHSDSRWFKVIQQKISDISDKDQSTNYELTQNMDILRVAQELLQSPMGTMFSMFKEPQNE